MGRDDERYNRAPRTRQVQGAFAFLDDLPGKASGFGWRELDPGEIGPAVIAWCQQGYAITFGSTSDGGALGIHLIAGGVVRKHYCATPDEAETILRRVAGTKEGDTGK